jgi:hypothetical protein
MDLFWPKRYELLKSTGPYIDSPDTSKTSAALDILYRLRGFHPMTGLGFNEETWEKEQAGFFSDLDAVVYPKLNRLLLTKDDSLLRNLALYSGVSVSPISKAALLQLAKNPAVVEQALICLGWHKDPKDMDDLLPFMLEGGSEASSLPLRVSEQLWSTCTTVFAEGSDPSKLSVCAAPSCVSVGSPQRQGGSPVFV